MRGSHRNGLDEAFFVFKSIQGGFGWRRLSDYFRAARFWLFWEVVQSIVRRAVNHSSPMICPAVGRGHNKYPPSLLSPGHSLLKLAGSPGRPHNPERRQRCGSRGRP